MIHNSLGAEKMQVNLRSARRNLLGDGADSGGGDEGEADTLGPDDGTTEMHSVPVINRRKP